MGFGGLFKKQTNTAQAQTVQAIQSANQQILANNQTQAAAQATAAAASAAPSVIASAGKAFDPPAQGGPNTSALGVLDFIKTSPGGLKNQPKNGGRLTVLGN